MFIQGYINRPIIYVRSIDPYYRITSVDLPPISILSYIYI